MWARASQTALQVMAQVSAKNIGPKIAITVISNTEIPPPKEEFWRSRYRSVFSLDLVSWICCRGAFKINEQS